MHTVAVPQLPDVLKGLARSYLFEDLDQDDLAPLAAVVTTRRLVPGETVCRPATPRTRSGWCSRVR